MDDPGDDPTPQAGADGGRLLLDYLAQRDVPCPACRYNLRQLQTDRCPECGNRLRLTVGVVGGLSSAWITALVATLLPAGIGLPFHVVALIALGHGENILEIAREPEGLVFLVLFFYALLCHPAAIALLWARRRFLALPRGRQKQIAAAAGVLGSLFGLIAFMLLASLL